MDEIETICVLMKNGVGVSQPIPGNEETLSILLDFMANGDADIQNIQNEVSKITNSAGMADEFIKQITIYKQYETLVNYQLDQVKEFLESVDGNETESLRLAEIYTSVQKTISDYTTVVMSNNNKATSVKKMFNEVKGRVLRLRSICENISFVVQSIEQFSFDNRKAYSESLIFSNNLIKYPIVKRIPQLVNLTDNKVELVLPDYFINTNAFTYEVFNNFDANAVIEPNSNNVMCLKITGGYRGKTYNLIVKATNPRYQNNIEVIGGGLNINSNYQKITMKLNNYTFITFPVKEDYSPPIPVAELYLHLDSVTKSIVLRDQFHFINDEMTYIIANVSVDISKTIIELKGGILEITGKNADKEYIISVIATDFRNRDSKPLLITCLDVPKLPLSLKQFVSVVSSSDVVLNLDEYFEHVLELQYTFNVTDVSDASKSNSSHITLNNNVMTIGKNDRNITYVVNITCKTIHAETVDQQIKKSFLVREPVSVPALNNVSYSTINMTLPGTGIGTSTGADGITRLIDLATFFKSTGPITYTVNQVNENNSNAIYFILHEPMPEGRLLRINSNYRNVRYTIIVTASTESGQTNMTINVTELDIPKPSVKSGGLESLHVNGYYNTSISLYLTTYFSGMNIVYKSRIFYVQNNIEYAITDNRVFISNAVLIFDLAKLQHNMQIFIQVTAENTNTQGGIESAVSTLVFHEDVIDPTVTKAIEDAFVSNDSASYIMSDYFGGVDLTYSAASSVQEAITISNGVLTIQGQYRDISYDVVVTATSVRFDGNVTKNVHSTLHVEESMSPVSLKGTGLISNLAIHNDENIILSDGFEGTDITYNYAVYTDVACTIPDTDIDVSISVGRLYINNGYRNKEYYVKVSATKTNHKGVTSIVHSTIKVTEDIQPVQRIVQSVSQLNMTDSTVDYLLSEYFTGPGITYREIIRENVTANVFITTNSNNERVLRVVPAYRDMPYNIEVFAENGGFTGSFYIVSLVFPVRELAQPLDYVNVISEILQGDIERVLYGINGTYMESGTDIISIDLTTYFQNYTHASIGEVLSVPVDSSTYTMLPTHAVLTGNVIQIEGAYRNKYYNLVIRLTDDNNMVFNKVLRVSESIRRPSIKNIDTLVSPWLTDVVYKYDLTTLFDGILPLNETTIVPYVYRTVDGVDIDVASETNVQVTNIDYHELVIVPNNRNMEYKVRVVARNVDHLGTAYNSMPFVFTIKEDVLPVQINTIEKVISTSIEPIVYDLYTIFSIVPNDFSYIVLDDAGNIELSSDTDVVIKDGKMTVYPNYRNRHYTIRVIGSFPNYTGNHNDLVNDVEISETIKSPLLVYDFADLGTVNILVNTSRVYDLNDYFTGVGLQFAIESIYTEDAGGIKTEITNSDVTLVTTILTIRNVSGLGKYMITVKASNTDYISTTYNVKSTLVVFEPGEVSGGLMDTGTGDSLSLLKEFPTTQIVRTNGTRVYILSEYFSGSDRQYSIAIKDLSNNAIDISLVDVTLYKNANDNVCLQVCANYRNMYYNICVTCISTVSSETLESTLKIVETVKAPIKINGGLESESTLLLTDNTITYDMAMYFGGNFMYPFDAITVVSATGQAITDHNATLTNGILSITGAYRNTEYFIKITVYNSNIDNVYKYTSVSTLHVVEQIRPIQFAP